MSFRINEALLEMHYYAALHAHFSKILGVEHLQILKPTQRREKWLGFDQGWVSSANPPERVEQNLLDFIQDGSYFSAFRAFFLQFKVVEERKSKRGAPFQWSVPWYSASISVKPNKDTGLSQHETLVRLSALSEAFVAYACPMIFTMADLVKPADLRTLRQIDVRFAPQGWLTNEGHKLAFESPTADAFWCSEPKISESLDLDSALLSLPVLTLDGLQQFLMKVSFESHSENGKPIKDRAYPPSLFVIATNE